MRRGVRGLLIVMGCQPWAVVGQPLVEPSRLERPWRPNGGVIAAGQRVAGTPWTEWTLGLWGQSPWAPLDEWSVGASLEGGGPWVSMEGQCGGRMTLTPTTSVQWMGALGMSSWPDLGQRAMALGLQMWTEQRTTWGDLRFDVRITWAKVSDAPSGRWTEICCWGATLGSGRCGGGPSRNTRSWACPLWVGQLGVLGSSHGVLKRRGGGACDCGPRQRAGCFSNGSCPTAGLN